MLFWNKICGFIIIFLLYAGISNGQSLDTSRIFPIKSAIKPATKIPFAISNLERSSPNHLISFSAIPENYYTQHFGIMCKKELAIEKATKIPFRFRLGSIQQCNYLEGKK